VNLADFNILAGRFGQSLGAQGRAALVSGQQANARLLDQLRRELLA